MKRIFLALIILVVWVSLSSAETYKSSFGFSIEIPSDWLIMSKQEIISNPNLFNFESSEFKNFDKDLLNKMKNMVAAGQVEIYFNKETSNSLFSDNINVIETIENLPQTISKLHQYCTELPQGLSKYFGKTVNVYKCEFRKIAEIDCLYLVFDGAVDGTRSMQYQIQKSPSLDIIITATCKNETFEIINKEFDEIMGSLKFQ
jgi:hypothetical protein